MVEKVKTIGRKIVRMTIDRQYESMSTPQWQAMFRAAGIPNSGLAMSVFKGTSKYAENAQTQAPTPAILEKTSNACGGLYRLNSINPHKLIGMIETIQDVQHRYNENSKWRKFEEIKKAKSKLEANGYKVIG